MLLHRILTAVPLALAAIWLILFQPTSVLLYVLLPIAVVCGYEWARLGGIQSSVSQTVFAILVGLFSWLCIEYFPQYLYFLLAAASLWWLAILFFLKSARPELKSGAIAPVKLSIAFLVVPSTIVAMYIRHGTERGAEWLLYSMMLVWIADSGAYFSGKKFGKTKLAPNVSPGKTREGLWGALLATAIYALLAAYQFALSLEQSAILITISLLLTIFSVAGDLYESF